MRIKFNAGMIVLAAGAVIYLYCAGLSGDEGNKSKDNADASLKQSGVDIKAESKKDKKFKGADGSSKKKTKKKKRDINKDIAVCNLSAGDLSGGGLVSRSQEEEFLRAEGLIRGRKGLSEALGILEGIRVNLKEGPGRARVCVNLAMARAYFFQKNYGLSLKHSHRAIQSSTEYSDLWMKSAFLAGISYRKLGEIKKSDIMLDMVISRAKGSSAIAGLASIYSSKLK